MARHKSTVQCYRDMKQRCLNPKHHQYHNYGGRGIYICNRWLDGFDSFYADMGQKPEGMTLDRIDNDGPYSPDNCRWATKREQRLNQRSCTYLEFNGERLTVREWAKRIGRHETTLHGRLREGWPIQDVLSPIKYGRHDRAGVRNE